MMSIAERLMSIVERHNLKCDCVTGNLSILQCQQIWKLAKIPCGLPVADDLLTAKPWISTWVGIRNFDKHGRHTTHSDIRERLVRTKDYSVMDNQPTQDQAGARDWGAAFSPALVHQGSNT
jgi:hypothetical protein